MTDTTSPTGHEGQAPKVRPKTSAWNLFHWVFSKCILCDVCQQSPFELQYFSVCETKPLHKLLVFYTRTFLEVLRRVYAKKVPFEPVLGQKHLCYPWRCHLEIYSVIWDFWNYWAPLTDHETEMLQTNVVLMSTHSTIPVALSHSKGGWKLKLNAPQKPRKILKQNKDTWKIIHFVYPGVLVHRATSSMEQLQAAVAAHRSCSTWVKQSRDRIIEP